jgi:MFS family permease
MDTAIKPGDDAGILLTWRESPPASRALLAGIFVNRLGAFIQVFLVLFLTTRGFTTVQAGTALAVFTTGAVLGVIVGGAMTDRLGPRLTILISMVGGAGLTLAILYLNNYTALLVVVFLVGLVGGAYRPAASSLLSELTPKHRQVMIFAMYRLAYNLGNTAAPLIGAALVAVSYNLLFWGEAVAALGYAVIAAIALPRRGAEAAAEPAEEEADAAAGTAADRRRGYLAVIADRRYVLFMVALLINAMVYVQYLSTLPVAMREAGLGTTWFSAMVALNGIIVISCELLVTKVVQRWPMRIVVVVGFLLLGGGMAFYALPFGVAAFIIGTLIWSLAEIIAGPTMFAYPAVAGPARLRGRYIGAGTAMFGVGSASGSVIGLAVWNQVGEAVWGLCGLACLAGLAAGWTGMRPSVAASPAGAAEAEATEAGAAPEAAKAGAAGAAAGATAGPAHSETPVDETTVTPAKGPLPT